ncbi:MAG: class II aldolase [Clostridia bacterium]|nr:class II aldolase [Clostridia bacterium]
MVLNELVSLSNIYGSNEELVLAGGGNTSAKDGDVMYIKGSGTQLATITDEGFVKMSRAALADIFTKEYPSDDDAREAQALADLTAAKMPGEENKRPSVETLLHSLFPHRFVFHVHPALVNGLTCSVNGKEAAEELFGDGFVWIESCKPGYTLSKICYDKMNAYKAQTGKDADMLLLQNHGIFLAADTVEEIGEKLAAVMSKLNAAVVREPDFDSGDYDGEKAQKCFDVIYELYGDDAVITYEPSAEAIRFAESPETAKAVMKPFTPDHIVYCKAEPVYGFCQACIRGAVNEYVDEHGYMPKIIIINGCGFFAVDLTPKGSETAATLFNDALKVATYSESFGGPLHMTDELSDFITNWEVESYRQKQNA